MKSKRTKRVLGSLVCLFLVIALVQIPVYAEAIISNNISYELGEDEATVVGYETMPSGELIIPESITIQGIDYTVTKIADNAFVNCNEITSINLPNTIVEFGKLVFANNTRLESIDMPDELKKMGESTFQGCTTLTSIVISEGLKQMGRSTFEGCTALKSVVLPNELEKTGGRTFSGCTSLEEVNIPTSLKIIESRDFSGCTALKKMHLPDNIQKIEATAFESCFSLSDLVLNEGLQEIGNAAFDNVQALKVVKIPSTTTKISDTAFRTAIGGTDESIPPTQRIAYEVHPDNPSYTSKDGVLYNKEKTELLFYPSAKEDEFFTLPETVTSFTKFSFYYTAYLKTIALTSDQFEASGYYMYEYAYSLESLNIDGIELPLHFTGSVSLEGSYNVSLLDTTIKSVRISRAMGINNEDETSSFVYCIEPEIEAGTFSFIVPSLDPDIINVIGGNHQNMDRYTTETIELIGWCMQAADVQMELNGMKLTKEQSIRYVVAQSIIYEIACGNYNDTKKDDILDKIESDMSLDDGIAARAVAEEIMDFIDEKSQYTILHAIPSFSNFTTSQAPTYNYDYNEAMNSYYLKLTDTNGVLEKFEVAKDTLPQGVNAVIDGDDLVITSSSPIYPSINIRLDPIESTSIYREVRILYHPTDQIRIISDVRDVSPVVHINIESERPLGNVSIEKEVKGNDANKDESFHFVMTLDDQELSGQYGDLEFIGGKCEFDLKHGESKTALNLPAGTHYDVEEIKAKGYTVSSQNESGVVLEGDTTHVLFINTKNITSPEIKNPKEPETTETNGQTTTKETTHPITDDRYQNNKYIIFMILSIVVLYLEKTRIKHNKDDA